MKRKHLLRFVIAIMAITLAGNLTEARTPRVNQSQVQTKTNKPSNNNAPKNNGKKQGASNKSSNVNNTGSQNQQDIEGKKNAYRNILGETGKRNRGSSSSSGFSNRTFTVKGVSFTMVAVEGGTFTMGATREQNNTRSDAVPHQVTLSSYYIGETQVTQELWKAIMGENPCYADLGDNRPVQNVSWDDCQLFITRLNKLTGEEFSLPTEAQWEFAARGGVKSRNYRFSGSNNIDDVGWYRDNSSAKIHEVKELRPNELGIYDMTGNVWEWCQDYYDSHYYEKSPAVDPVCTTTSNSRVHRGGWCYTELSDAMVSFRNWNGQDFRNGDHGLRLAMKGGNNRVSNSNYNQNQSSSSAVKTFTAGGVSFSMIKVEGGTFKMGGTSEQDGSYDDEKPVHQVTLSTYYIGETEVTQELWKAVMGSNPSSHKGDFFPVENITWDEVQRFLSRLNSMTGQNFRLPTEAEWEFAARGGVKSRHYQYSGGNNLEDVAWSGESTNATCRVKTKQANELGIFDMSGNVWEWCSDYFDASFYANSPSYNPTGPSTSYNTSRHCMRGGSYTNYNGGCRNARRDFHDDDDRQGNVGIRIVL